MLEIIVLESSNLPLNATFDSEKKSNAKLELYNTLEAFGQ
jgi:hypothetical protein